MDVRDSVRIQIKGIREGLLVNLQNGSWFEASESLFRQIEEQADFFKGARLALDGFGVIRRIMADPQREKAQAVGGPGLSMALLG